MTHNFLVYLAIVPRRLLTTALDNFLIGGGPAISFFFRPFPNLSFIVIIYSSSSSSPPLPYSFSSHSTTTAATTAAAAAAVDHNLGGGLGLFNNSAPLLSILCLHPPTNNLHPLFFFYLVHPP